MFKKFRKTAQNRRRKQARPICRRPQLESLEGRELMAADAFNGFGNEPGAQVEGDTLVVRGGDQDDRISISSSRRGITVRLGNERLGPFSQIADLHVFGGEGDDVLRISRRLDLPTVLYGGAGNDRIVGGGGPVVADGGPVTT